MTSIEQARREEQAEDILAQVRIGNLCFAFKQGWLDGLKEAKALAERLDREPA